MSVDLLVVSFLVALSLVGLFWLAQYLDDCGIGADTASLRTFVASDPCLVACLRGGSGNAIRVAVISLLERGLLVTCNHELRAVQREAARQASSPLDKAILGVAATATHASHLFDDPVVIAEADGLRAELRNKKLMPTRGMYHKRIGKALMIALICGGASPVAFFVLTEHQNWYSALCVVFIFIGALFAIFRIGLRRRTALGDRVLRGIEAEFATLRARRRSLKYNSQAEEVAFYAAVFGIGVLPNLVLGELIGLGLHSPADKGHGNGSDLGGSGCGYSSSCSSGGDGGGDGGGGGCGGGSGCGSGCGGGGCG
jgi:uncharacterized protein (TIGR04222 family)